MTAFQTPREMFHDWQHEMNYLREKEKDCYLDQMDQYKAEAVSRISKDIHNKIFSDVYAESLAHAYVDGNKRAEIMFNYYDLKDLHLYALLDREDLFIEEYDRYRNL